MNLEKFKNKFVGERVFIVGNGPSLKETNLDLIEDEYSFGMNRIANIYEDTEWRPSFFICTSINVKDKEWRKDILNTIELGVTSFIWDELDSYFPDTSNIYRLNCENPYTDTFNPPVSWWSDDITSYVTKYGTSMIVALQIAVYMGFDDIYILGADLGFKSSFLQKIFYKIGLDSIGHRFDKNHFFGSYGTPGLSPELLNKKMISAHQLALKATEDQNVNIYNATKGGELEIYKRVRYEDLFKIPK
ncbi:MAG: 6-hydroxymethylpterin diphosphokinase MptE-like protein [Bacteroidota bacterium]